MNNRFLKTTFILIFNIIMIAFISQWLKNHVDLQAIIDETKHLNQSSLLISFILGILLYIFYGLRMALLLDIELKKSTQIVIIGFGLNAFLPFRLGDVIKVILTKHFFGIDLTKTTFATVIEKGLDLIVIAVLASIFIFFNVTFYTVLLLAILALGILFFCLRNNRLLRIHHHLMNKMIAILQTMLNKRKLKAVIFSTLSIWGLTWIVFYLFFNFNMDVGQSFTPIDAIFLLIFTTLSIAIPSLPAGVGLFESGIVYYLTKNFNFLPEKAIAYAIIYHLIIVLPQIFFTLIILFINMLPQKKLRQAQNAI